MLEVLNVISRITVSKLPEHLPSLPGYEFEFVLTPLTPGGVGMFIDNTLKYGVIELEKRHLILFNAFGLTLCLKRKETLYGQHNFPESFSELPG